MTNKKPRCFGQHGAIICYDPELWPLSTKKLECKFIAECKENPLAFGGKQRIRGEKNEI